MQRCRIIFLSLKMDQLQWSLLQFISSVEGGSSTYSGWIHCCLAGTVNHLNTLQLQHRKFWAGKGAGSGKCHREEHLRKSSNNMMTCILSPFSSTNLKREDAQNKVFHFRSSNQRQNSNYVTCLLEVGWHEIWTCQTERRTDPDITSLTYWAQHSWLFPPQAHQQGLHLMCFCSTEP